MNREEEINKTRRELRERETKTHDISTPDTAADDVEGKEGEEVYDAVWVCVWHKGSVTGAEQSKYGHMI